MCITNRVIVPLVCFFISITVFSPNLVVVGLDVEQRSFKRVDPLRHLKYYNGGFDIENTHYWASAAFTGVHGYATAGVWFFCGLTFGAFLAVKNLCCRSQISNHVDRYFFFIFLIVLLFSLLAIIASSFVIAANQSSHKRMKKLKATIINAGGDARSAIMRITKKMTEMEYLLLPYDQKTTVLLNVTTHRLRKESITIQHFLDKNGRSVDLAIRTSYLAHVVTVSVNMGLLITALVLLLLHWHPGFFIVIFCCWILTILFWMLTGVDYFIQTIATDTCYALTDYEQNPHNSSLKSILPCMDATYSSKYIPEIGMTIHNAITELNTKISQLLEKFGVDDRDDDTIFGIKRICDPFAGAPNNSYDLRACAQDELPIGDLPNILKEVTCYNKTITEACNNSGLLLPEPSYHIAKAYSLSIQDLIDIYPDLQSLSACSYVKDAFTDVVSQQCRPLKSSLHLLWASMLPLSIFMMLLVFTLVVKAYVDNGRSFSRCSIIPNTV